MGHRKRWPRRAAAVLALAGAVFLGSAVPALADTGAPAPSASADAPITDSSGVPIEAYQALPIDRGGWAANQDKMFWSKPIDLIWGNSYKDAQVAIMFNRWSMQFGWVDWITGPAKQLSTGFESLTAKLPWQALVGSLAGGFAGWLLLRGRTGAAWSEVVVASVLLALATTVLSNPVETVAGNEGLIVKARDAAQNASSEILSNTRGSDGKQPAEVVNASATQPMVDAFVRIPYQTIAFGHTIDQNPDCKARFDAVMKEIKSSSDATGEKIRNAVAGCDDGAAKHAAAPDAYMVIDSATAWSAMKPLGWFVLALGALLLLSIVLLVWEAFKCIWNAKAGVVPGGSRGSLIRSIVMAGVSLAFVVAVFVFQSLYMILIRMVFAQTLGQKTFILYYAVNSLLAFGIGLMLYIWIRWRKKGEKLADRLRRLGAGSAERQPPAITMGRVYKALRDLSNHRLLKGAVNARKPPARLPSTQAPSSPGSGPPPTGRPRIPQRELTAGPGRGQLPPPGGGSGGPGPVSPVPGSPAPSGRGPLGGGSRGAEAPVGPVLPGIVLDSTVIPMTPSERRRAAAAKVIRAAAGLHPYSRAAVAAVDVAKVLRPAPRSDRTGPTRAQAALAARLRTSTPIPYRPAGRDRP